MFATHHELSNLVAVIDANNSQVDGTITSVTSIEPLVDKWRAFGWHVEEVDGHDVEALLEAFSALSRGRPLVVIARTSIIGRMKSFPPSVDGHFIKLDPALQSAVVAELKDGNA